MRKLIPPVRLLAFPGLFIGLIQVIFGFLSAFLFYDGVAKLFILPGILVVTLSTLLLLTKSKNKLSNINFKESMLYVSYTWIISGFVGAVPIFLIANVSITDAVFESISALTTTGASILSGLDDQPKSFLMYRQFLQWIGGLGVIIFVVAVLPILNIGGMKILKAETPGPIKDDKLAPRIANSARYFWYIYLVITVLCSFGFVLSGMSWFDAVAHSFSTVSTGGFSTHDSSIGFFNSRWVELNAVIFMSLGAISFSLHFKFFTSLDLFIYKRDEETRVFLSLIALLSIILSIILLYHSQFDTYIDNILKSVFLLVSFITSTGFGSGDFTHWPYITQVILIFSSYLGGCAGSTAGGNKIIRNIFSFKLIVKQIKQTIHPNGVFKIRYNNKGVTPDVLSSTAAFITFSAFISIFITIILMSTGLDFWTSFSAVSACINVAGPAFGELSGNFQPVSDFGTWILSFTMLLGRLEFFTLLVIFSPYFWRD